MENNMNTNVSTEENTNINDILENNCLTPNENNESKEQLRKEKRRLYTANKRKLDKQVINGEIHQLNAKKY